MMAVDHSIRTSREFQVHPNLMVLKIIYKVMNTIFMMQILYRIMILMDIVSSLRK